jgi:hypothetical protein
MSERGEKTLCVCIVIVVVAIVFGAFYAPLVYFQPDYTQAKFEPGDMVQLRVGGMGQVITRKGVREGIPGRPVYIFRYEVRQKTLYGARTQTFQEWELKGEPS